MSEMLNPTSFESFRAFTLDSISRLDEVISLCYEVERERIPRKALDPVFAELLWSLGKDSAAQVLAASEIDALKEKETNHAFRLTDLSAHCFLIKKLLSDTYKSTIERMLIDRVSDEGHRLEFRKLSGFYCSRIINLGYSKRYIASVVEEVFFQKEKRRAGARTLSRFFNYFRDHPRTHIVQALVPKEFSLFLRRLGYKIMTPDELDAVASLALRDNLANNAEHNVLVTEQTSFDSYGAIVQVHGFLTSLRAMTYLYPHNMSCDWVNSMFVRGLRSNKGILISKIDFEFDKPSPVRPTITSGRRLKSMVAYANRLINNFDQSSSERLFSSLNTGALARNGASQENQLISFWSAIEVLLSDSPPDTPRIVHYANLLVPCVCLRHARRQAAALFDQLLVAYRRAFMKIIKKETNANVGDGHTRLAYVLLAAENDALRSELCELCKDNPLALHRLWKFRRDYESPKSALSAINGHGSRV